MKYSKGSGDAQFPAPQKPYQGIQILQKVPTKKEIDAIIGKKKKSKPSQAFMNSAVLSASDFVTEQFVPDEKQIIRIKKKKTQPDKPAPVQPPEPKPAPPRKPEAPQK